ncbi:MAG: hypothetical protein WC683_19430, partial [bacterium]
MSIIYLWDNTQGWHHHNTDDVGVLKEHGVSIGARASIGDGASIGYGASIGDGASIGYGASIGDGASIG